MPGWLVEGIADYIRFFKFEPGKIRSANARHTNYDGSYRVTAQFLAYLARKYDPKVVQKLNALAREGKLRRRCVQVTDRQILTGLNEEWRPTLPP